MKYGFNAQQFISDKSYNVKECVKKIMARNPKIVGFTVYETNYMQCVLISRRLKTFHSDIIIIFGGPTPSVQSREILESELCVDLCVRGEGEETLLKLLQIFSKNNFKLAQTDLENIKGITYRKDHKVMINPDSNVLYSNRFIKNYLDTYPSPYLSGIIPASEAYQSGIITARGCNQNCVFCNCAIIYKNNIYFHSIERVIEELLYLNDFKKPISPIPINDDGFTIIPRRAREICERIIENEIELPLTCITRCDKITKDLMDLMKQAGFKSLGFSLESAVPRILREIGKVNPPESEHLKNFDKEIEFINNLKEMTSYAKKIGIKSVFISIMVGLPGESIQDAQKTIEMVKELDIDFYTHNNLHIFKGTPLYQNHRDYGYNVKPIGQKNKIFLRNDFPYDVYQIKLAPKSLKEINSKAIDYNSYKILSLSTNRQIMRPFFDTIIIQSDSIKKSLVKWIQENLVINGLIIHIYSNKSNYMRLWENNFKTLCNEFSPTLYYESYYLDNSTNVINLKSGRMLQLGENIGLPIRFRNTDSVLNDFKKGYGNMENLICTENNLSDASVLYNFLVDISKEEDYFNYLLESKPLPQFQNLCRWTKFPANCQTLETIIVGNDDSIRICWNSDSIGKVGDSFSKIRENLQDLSKEQIERRNCNNCHRNELCLKCMFPKPLSSDEYCECMRKNDTNEPAKIINAFNILNDILFKPIIRFDF
jgi:radical SAM superfamily enzyme YgiQ (UPF0313 family)